LHYKKLLEMAHIEPIKKLTGYGFSKSIKKTKFDKAKTFLMTAINFIRKNTLNRSF